MNTFLNLHEEKVLFTEDEFLYLTKTTQREPLERRIYLRGIKEQHSALLLGAYYENARKRKRKSITVSKLYKGLIN